MDVKARVYHVQVNVRDASRSLPFWKAVLGYLEYRTVHEEGDKSIIMVFCCKADLGESR